MKISLIYLGCILGYSASAFCILKPKFHSLFCRQRLLPLQCSTDNVESLTNTNTTFIIASSECDIPINDQRRVCWTASAKGSVRVKDQLRTVEQYMALPSSEYSVLSADQIERLNDREFKCTLGTMNFFGTKITPVLYVDVNVLPEECKSIISVTRAETIGSEIAEKVNGTFSISAVNTVTVGRDGKDRKTLESETSLKIDCVVPSNSLPLRVVQSGGNFLMQSTLTVIIQAFVRILAADFKRWSAGSDSRDAMEGEKLA
eukprot:gene7478-15306_t